MGMQQVYSIYFFWRGLRRADSAKNRFAPQQPVKVVALVGESPTRRIGRFTAEQSSRVMGKLNWQVRDRLRRWLWRKHGRKRAWWSDDPDQRLQGEYGLWPLPTRVAWKQPLESHPNALG